MSLMNSAKTAYCVALTFCVLTLPLVAGVHHVSVVPVPTTQDALHPGRAYISRATLSDAEAAAQLEIVVPLKMTNFADLQARLAQGERIPPKEMAAKYEPTEAQYQQVVKFLKSQGFTITLLDPHHLAVFAEAPVHQVASALHVKFARVTAEGHEYTSAISEPTIPDSLKGFVMGVNGLQPHIRPHPHAFNLRPAAAPSPNSLGGPSYYTPQQIASVYNVNPLYTAGATGAGQSIAIVIDAFPSTSDLTSFWSGMGISQSLANITLIQAVAGTMPAPYDEETLDTEWASSMAPGAQVRVYGTTSLSWGNLEKGYLAILNDAQNHPEYGIHQMSMSYGLGEAYLATYQAPFDDMYFAELTAAGVTCFASSGDGGTTPGSHNTNTGSYITAEFPSTDPNVTAVGGTSLNAPNGVESDEEVWSGSGGGVSIYFPRPSWQNGNGVGSSATMRQVPDIAAAADPYHGARIFLNGQWMSIGGTSWSSPTCAAMMALINQARASVNLPAVGLLNSKIYPLIGTTCFRDITAGSNSSPTSGGLYNATVGYDLCTGIGSMQAYNLAAQLSQVPGISVAPTGTLSLGAFPIGSTPATANFTISNPGALALNVTSIAVPAGFSVNWSSGTVAPGGSQPVTVTCTATAAGSYAGNITISNNASATPTTIAVTATVTAPSIAVTPAGTLSLGTFQVGSTPATANFTISDPGGADLNVSNITAPSGFGVNWSSGAVAAGGSQQVAVTCTATTAGTYSGTITISNSASSTPATIAVTATVTAPAISVAQTGTLSLGSFQVGTTSSTASFTISNPGSAALNVSSITVPAGFSVNWSSGTIAAGDSQQVVVTCTATTAGSYSGNITISSNASSTPTTIAVATTVTPLLPGISVAPAGTLSLGTFQVGATPATASFTISDPGGAALNVSNIAVPSGFSVSWPSGTVAAGGSQPVTVTCTATTAGTYTGNITISSDASSTPATIAVTATVTAPSISVTPAGTLSLGSFQVGSTPATANFTISNPGSAVLNVSSVAVPSGFSVNWASGTIAVGGSQQVAVTCTATTAGSYSGDITISSNASSTPTTIAVTATVTPLLPAISVAPAGTLSLGTFKAGATPPTANFTISDTGGAVLNVSSVAVPSGFSVNWPSGTIAAGASQQVMVTYTATTAGSYAGNIVISSNASSTPTIGVTATVTAATAPSLSSSSTSSLTATSVTLIASVNPNGSATQGYFQYGRTTSYGSQSESVSVGSGTSSTQFLSSITGLTGGTTYHYPRGRHQPGWNGLQQGLHLQDAGGSDR